MTISGQPEVLKAIEIYPDVFIFSVSNPFVHNFNFVKKKKKGGGGLSDLCSNSWSSSLYLKPFTIKMMIVKVFTLGLHLSKDDITVATAIFYVKSKKRQKKQ